MAVPKQRHNSSRGKRRRAGHKKLEAQSLIPCKSCKKEIVPHRLCPYCGTYKGEELTKLSNKEEKKEKMSGV